MSLIGIGTEIFEFALQWMEGEVEAEKWKNGKMEELDGDGDGG
jgi:hypothetical protein